MAKSELSSRLNQNSIISIATESEPYIPALNAIFSPRFSIFLPFSACYTTKSELSIQEISPKTGIYYDKNRDHPQCIATKSELRTIRRTASGSML